MSLFTRRIIAICGFFVISGESIHAHIRLPQLIGDGMVLQRDTKLKIWGWADPGEKVSVVFNGKKETTVTNMDGRWLVLLPAMKPGGPFTMTIKGVNAITLQDILIGDVWFCSGQSNMVLSMERVKEKYPEDIANANYPQIRNFFIPTLADVTRIHDDLPQGKWMAADPKNVLGFGAASYFFARDIYLKYHIPIGIINASVGGTPIEAWIGEAGFDSFPQIKTRIKNFGDTGYMNTLTRKSRVFGDDRDSVTRSVPAPDQGLSGPLPWYAIDYVPEGWHSFWLPGYWADQGVKGLNGTVWFRKEIEVPVTMTGKPAKLFMGRIVDADQTYVNGVMVGSVTYQYPPRRYELPARSFKTGKK